MSNFEKNMPDNDLSGTMNNTARESLSNEIFDMQIFDNFFYYHITGFRKLFCRHIQSFNIVVSGNVFLTN